MWAGGSDLSETALDSLLDRSWSDCGHVVGWKTHPWPACWWPVACTSVSWGHLSLSVLSSTHRSETWFSWDFWELKSWGLKTCSLTSLLAIWNYFRNIWVRAYRRASCGQREHGRHLQGIFLWHWSLWSRSYVTRIFKCYSSDQFSFYLGLVCNLLSLLLP